MKILLTHGLCHAVIIDTDSKFKATFTEVLKLLQLNKREISKGNNQAMLVERFNKYLNKVMKIFNNERGTNKTAWNSSPITGTDISKSLLVMDREFNFPIDFATDEMFSTNNNPQIIFEYTKNLVEILSQSRDIYKILIDEHRTMHREMKNSEIKNEIEFKVGDVMFARRQVQSNKKKGLVDKSQFSSTGPWKIIVNNRNGTYQIQHIKTGKSEKRHASMLDLSPSNFIPHKPLKGADHSFSEIHKDVRCDRFQHAGLSEPPAGTTKKENIQVPDLKVLATDIADGLPPFPSLHELDKEYNEELGISSNQCNTESEEIIQGSQGNIHVDTSPQNLDPRPPNLQYTSNVLVPKIIASKDHLFFISHKINGQERNKWKLIQVDLRSTMALNPSALTDGKYIANIRVEHPADRNHDIRQNRFLPYYQENNRPHKEYSPQLQLIRPAPEAAAYAAKNNLQKARIWINLTQPSVYIYEPFNFAIIHGRQSSDKISENEWKKLIANSKKYDDAPPKLTEP